jgi:hypothetical protein
VSATLSTNRSAEHRLGQFPTYSPRAGAVLGVPIARFMAELQHDARWNLFAKAFLTTDEQDVTRIF